MPRLPLVSGLIGLLVLTGCGGAGAQTASEPESSPQTSSSAPTTPEPAGQGSPANKKQTAADTVPETLDFSATTVAGESFDGASLAGQPTLLWFWAPWCPTCRGQIPQVEGYASTYDGDLNVIGVGALDSAEAIAAFADDVPGVTHLEDLDGALFRRFGITEQSSFVLLDADGAVTFEAGYGESGDLDQQVQAIVG